MGKLRSVYLQMCLSYMSHTLSADLLRHISSDYLQKTETLGRLGLVCGQPTSSMTNPHVTVSMRGETALLIERFRFDNSLQSCNRGRAGYNNTQGNRISEQRCFRGLPLGQIEEILSDRPSFWSLTSRHCFI